MTPQHVAGVRIKGVACAVPRHIVKNDGAAARAGKAVGVLERRFVSGEGNDLLTLASTAASRLLDELDWVAPPDALIFVTQTAPRRMPSISCELHHALNMPESVPVFDLNMACSGYTYGLWVAASLRVKRCLLVVGDTISQYLDNTDASTYPIFGDAVSATALELCGENCGITFVGGTDGSGADALQIKRDIVFSDFVGKAEDVSLEMLHMDGEAVFNFAVSQVPPLISKTVMGAHVDWYLLHQANELLVRHIGKKAGVPPEKMPLNMSRYGNTSSASIPLLLCDSDCSESIRTKKNRVAMFGFGAGFSYGSILTTLDCISTSLVEV